MRTPRMSRIFNWTWNLTERSRPATLEGHARSSCEAIKASGVKDHFFAYLKGKIGTAQFVIIENDPAPAAVGSYATIHFFVGNEGAKGRKGFF